jgi:hypothetical protein
MATLTVYEADLDGVVAAYVAAAGGGDTFANDGNTALHIKNADASPTTVTVTAISACNQGTLHDSVTVVAAGDEAFIGVFDKKRFNTVSTGAASVSYSNTTSITVAAIKY